MIEVDSIWVGRLVDLGLSSNGHQYILHINLESENIDDYSFFVLSGSMKAVLQLLTDEKCVGGRKQKTTTIPEMERCATFLRITTETSLLYFSPLAPVQEQQSPAPPMAPEWIGVLYILFGME